MSEPVTTDAQAAAAELLRRAAADLANAVAACIEREAQGGTGVREGILPGQTGGTR